MSHYFYKTIGREGGGKNEEDYGIYNNDQPTILVQKDWELTKVWSHL